MNQQSFLSFVFRERKNRKLVLIVLLAIILQIILFKYLYPFADFNPDTIQYVYAASSHWAINFYPIGYSKFLVFFHLWSHSDTSLVIFQYLLFEICCLFLFFTVLYFYSPGKSTQYILFTFFFFNPLFLYLSNHITSDTLFAALSIWWLTELLWIINRPRTYHIFTQAILLFICFTIRNNAYYYPILTILVFMLSNQTLKWKLLGIITPLILIVPFIINTRNKAEELTGKKQFSLFTGWQLANNALYMYRHIKVDSTKLPSAESRELDHICRKVFSRVIPDFDDYLSEYEANFFIKEPKSPLKLYFYARFTPKNEYEKVAAWGTVSAVFDDYGSWLIKNYPIAFARYFVLRNFKNYLLPGLEELKTYNMNENRIDPVIQNWFDYKTPDIDTLSWTMQGKILAVYPYLFLFLNILCIGSIVWMFTKRRSLVISREFRSTLKVAGTFLLLNFLFCLVATIIVLRYELIPMIIALVFPLLLIEVLDKSTKAIGLAGDKVRVKKFIPEFTNINQIDI